MWENGYYEWESEKLRKSSIEKKRRQKHLQTCAKNRKNRKNRK